MYSTFSENVLLPLFEYIVSEIPPPDENLVYTVIETFVERFSITSVCMTLIIMHNM
jgi:hypothetical protein